MASKSFGTKSYPKEALSTSGLMTRMEPLLTPELLRSRYLHNVQLKNYSNDQLKDEIVLAMNEIEVLTGINIDPVLQKERIPYDYALYKNFIHVQVNHRPILSLQRLSVESSDQQNIYNIPMEWIDAGLFNRGQINVMPLLTILATSSTDLTSGSPTGSMIFLQALNNFRWLPSFFVVEYTSGMCNANGEVPILINQLIGMTAAIGLLSSLQNNILYTSQSLSQDAISQSSQGRGNQSYQPRIEQLESQRERLMAHLKRIFHNKIFVSNI